ncbi:YdcF family protein [Listeria sp. PSOL-1]|uniref:YdcF family protein n=1 Tax=Listeria sp. PSOL-1 TaxID=1844999 RepID=UPI0013D4D46A|nr:YdcF family protein [Listeria sp. PSOL-1]
MKKLSFVIVIALFAIIYCCFIIWKMYQGRKAKPDANVKNVLVLGAKVNGKKARPSKILAERLDGAINYYHEHRDITIIVSGGKGPNESKAEAKVMGNYLETRGIPRKQIQIEAKSKRTKENIINAKERFNLKSVVIVTSDYHMYRALMLAKQKGLKASGFPIKTKTSRRLKDYCREFLAITYAWLMDRK